MSMVRSCLWRKRPERKSLSLTVRKHLSSSIIEYYGSLSVLVVQEMDIQNLLV